MAMDAAERQPRVFSPPIWYERQAGFSVRMNLLDFRATGFDVTLLLQPPYDGSLTLKSHVQEGEHYITAMLSGMDKQQDGSMRMRVLFCTTTLTTAADILPVWHLSNSSTQTYRFTDTDLAWLDRHGRHLMLRPQYMRRGPELILAVEFGPFWDALPPPPAGQNIIQHANETQCIIQCGDEEFMASERLCATNSEYFKAAITFLDENKPTAERRIVVPDECCVPMAMRVFLSSIEGTPTDAPNEERTDVLMGILFLLAERTPEEQIKFFIRAMTWNLIIESAGHWKAIEHTIAAPLRLARRYVDHSPPTPPQMQEFIERYGAVLALEVLGERARHLLSKQCD